MKIIPFYAGLLAIIFIFLSVRCIRLRRVLKIGVGDAGNPTLLRAMRVHANFAEYVPLCLLLLFFTEVNGAPAWLIHGLGLCLLVGRFAHAYGVSQNPERLQFRSFGMVMTFMVLTVCAVFLVVGFVRTLG